MLRSCEQKSNLVTSYSTFKIQNSKLRSFAFGLPQPDHSTAVFSTGELRIIPFVAGYRHHVRSVGRNRTEVFCHHYQFTIINNIFRRKLYGVCLISKPYMGEKKFVIQEQ